MKKIAFILLITILTFSANALKSQEYLDFNTSNGEGQKRILLVPFDPRIYYNDATAIIAEKEGETHDEIMEYFRYQLNLQLYDAMMDSCVIISLFSDNTRQDKEDIDGLYSIISYELVQAMPNALEDAEKEKKGYFARKREDKEQQRRKDEIAQYNTKIVDGEIVGKRQPTNDMYLNIVFHQPEVLTEIANRRDVDYFLFINQFDIKGNYGDPYLSGNSKSERTIKVHFSIYNSQGKLVHGSFGENKMPFDLADKQEIASLYFPEVIRQIVNNINF
ncbi:MAG TPA: hypothetical protein PLL66_03220 [Bacteroidales bacterium]|nr:hypothetical protein [Bacteroidales bacterium]